MRRPRHERGVGRPVLMVVIVIVGVAVASALVQRRPGRAPSPPPMTATPPPPSGGTVVAAGAALQPLLDAAPPGAVFHLEPGVHPGPLSIRRPLTLWGPRSAVVRSHGEGTTIDVQSDGVSLLGFTIDGSGDRSDLTDAAVHIHGSDVHVEGLRIVNALFGIAVELSRRVTLVGNEIVGDPATPIGLRGDGIRLWETRDSLVARNVLDDCRDVLIWYAPDNRVVGNLVRRGRYGTHMMYSSGCLIEANRYIGNVVSVFIMYSRDMRVRSNLLADNAAEGMGMGVKDSGDLIVTDNRFVKNNTGLYVDNSPFGRDETNVARGNLFALCDAAVVFHSSQTRNTFEGNTFRNNQSQVRVEGRGDAMGVAWTGNYFDDYAGYDFDRDGRGDVPYELRSLSNQLLGARPELAFFRGTSALSLLDMVGRVFPLYQPTPVLVDEAPRMGPLVAEGDAP